MRFNRIVNHLSSRTAEAKHSSFTVSKNGDECRETPQVNETTAAGKLVDCEGCQSELATKSVFRLFKPS